MLTTKACTTTSRSSILMMRESRKLTKSTQPLMSNTFSGRHRIDLTTKNLIASVSCAGMCLLKDSFPLRLLIIACSKERRGLCSAGLYSYSRLDNSTKTYGIPSSGNYISFMFTNLSITTFQLRLRIANGARRITLFLCSLMMPKLAVQPSKMLRRSKQLWMITFQPR